MTIYSFFLKMSSPKKPSNRKKTENNTDRWDNEGGILVSNTNGDAMSTAVNTPPEIKRANSV